MQEEVHCRSVVACGRSEGSRDAGRIAFRVSILDPRKSQAGVGPATPRVVHHSGVFEILPCSRWV